MIGNEHDIHVFANTLFKMGLELKKLQDFKEDFSNLLNIIKQDNTIYQFLLSPKIKRNEKKTFLKNNLGKTFSEEFIGFLIVVLAKRCQRLLFKIYNLFQNLVDHHEGVVRGKVVSVKKLDDFLITLIANMMAKRIGKQVILTNVIDEKIIGGFILLVEDALIDLSILKSLDEIKSQIQNIKLEGAAV